MQVIYVKGKRLLRSYRHKATYLIGDSQPKLEKHKIQKNSRDRIYSVKYYSGFTGIGSIKEQGSRKSKTTQRLDGKKLLPSQCTQLQWDYQTTLRTKVHVKKRQKISIIIPYETAHPQQVTRQNNTTTMLAIMLNNPNSTTNWETKKGARDVVDRGCIIPYHLIMKSWQQMQEHTRSPKAINCGRFKETYRATLTGGRTASGL